MPHPAVRDLLQSPGRNPAFQDLLHHLLTRKSDVFRLSGLGATAKALYLALLWQLTGRPLLVITW